mmetsp:Transcript_76395/g.211337  ORF Transcript_76395/g.211337 Transcript_76395/m.211337 type:complete len:225 (+) Transcript_76395:1576-2250(+)
MAHARHDGDGQVLRPGPVEHGRQGHDIVNLAVNDDGVSRHRRRVEAAGGRAHEHQAAGRLADPLGSARRHVAAEREAREQQGLARRAHRVQYGQRIVDLATPFVPGAGGLADAAEVEAHRAPAQLQEGTRQRLHDLVVHGAALGRVGVADQRRAGRRGATRRQVDGHLDLPGRARHEALFSLRVHRPTESGSTSRSTTSPSRRCLSTISSRSLVSTQEYQIASG